MIHLTSGPDEPLKPNSHPVEGAPLKIPQPIRVLAVEDDYLVGLNLEQQLLDAGYKVVGIAASADEALRIATEEKPQLVIMDIRLAGTRDGVDAAIELMTKLGIPSIFATAHGDEKTTSRAAAAKPLGWLQKPYSSASLIAAIKTALTKTS